MLSKNGDASEIIRFWSGQSIDGNGEFGLYFLKPKLINGEFKSHLIIKDFLGSRSDKAGVVRFYGQHLVVANCSISFLFHFYFAHFRSLEITASVLANGEPPHSDLHPMRDANALFDSQKPASKIAEHSLEPSALRFH